MLYGKDASMEGSELKKQEAQLGASCAMLGKSQVGRTDQEEGAQCSHFCPSHLLRSLLAITSSSLCPNMTLKSYL